MTCRYENHRVVGTEFNFHNFGSEGIIFRDRAAGLIRKIYSSERDRKFAEQDFKSEIEAFGIAMKSPEISASIPGKFRILDTQTVVDEKGECVSNQYFPDLAFEAEFINLRFVEIGSLPNSESSAIERKFKKVGINYTGDMAIAFSEDRLCYKVVDFKVRGQEIWHKT
ncbi:MAG: hypothetical protein GKR98_10265 [Boseongicola sp.]|nr:MAG: hypothetical protein GKR98_10265 [Boseongicola sp.]